MATKEQRAVAEDKEAPGRARKARAGASTAPSFLPSTRGTGRPSKLTADTEKRLLKLLRAGVPREVACAGVGIESRTLRLWLSRARAGEARYVAFSDQLEEAQAEAQSTMLGQIRKAGSRDWKALAWMLERCFSERYGYKSQVKVTVEAELERMLDVAEKTLGAEAAARLFEALAGDVGEGEAR